MKTEHILTLIEQEKVNRYMVAEANRPNGMQTEWQTFNRLAIRHFVYKHTFWDTNDSPNPRDSPHPFSILLVLLLLLQEMDRTTRVWFVASSSLNMTSHVE